MKRWAVLLLLLLLPLTLAPRTSWTTEAGYDLHLQTPREPVRVGAAVPLTLTVDSYSDEPVLAELQILAAVDDAKETVQIVAASPGCTVTGGTVECLVGPVEPHGSQVVRLVARPLVAGPLTFDVLDVARVEALGRYGLEVLGEPRHRS